MEDHCSLLHYSCVYKMGVMDAQNQEMCLHSITPAWTACKCYTIASGNIGLIQPYTFKPGTGSKEGTIACRSSIHKTMYQNYAAL